MPFFTKLIQFVLDNPVLAAFLERVFESVALKIWAELSFKTDSDPVFKAKFDVLKVELAQAPTEEAKRAVLKKIRALRAA